MIGDNARELMQRQCVALDVGAARRGVAQARAWLAQVGDKVGLAALFADVAGRGAGAAGADAGDVNLVQILAGLPVEESGRGLGRTRPVSVNRVKYRRSPSV